ncbi:MAG: hypothetical protein ABSE82_11880, partial [Nitrososphaerales archaeon]
MSTIPYSIFLHTGDKELNSLFSKKRELGLCVGQIKVEENILGNGIIPFVDTSIVIIEGDAGTGKTTLALQISSAVAEPFSIQNNTRITDDNLIIQPKISKILNTRPQWRVVFVSLEQSRDSLLNAVKHFGFGDNKSKERFPDLLNSSSINAVPVANQVRIYNLSPLPLTEPESDPIFAERFAQLAHMVEKLADFDKKINTLFVLDSLNAFTGKPLSRAQLRQLFALFRAKKVPLIATLEQAKKVPIIATLEKFEDNELNCGSADEAAGFLADVFVRLTRDSQNGYLQTFIEISKSRVCLQALGRHLYKTRTAQGSNETDKSTRRGLVTYPSIDFTLSQTRLDAEEPKSKQFRIATELEELLLDDHIDSPACLALQGPPGTHKLALGLNLGMSYLISSRQRVTRLLIVNFGGQGDIDFEGVAWVESRPTLRRLKHISSPRVGTKYMLKTYSTKVDQQQGNVIVEVFVLTFQIGQLTPEECFYRINRVLKDGEDLRRPFHSVLISDTAQLCTAFPLLSKNPMFFSALLDLFESKGLLTVGLGVHGTDTPSLRDIN